MLRSAGYFMGIDCPFLLDKDGCSRPYCPFRHTVSSLGHGTPKSPDVIEQQPSTSVSLDAVNQAIATLKSELIEDANTSHGSNSQALVDDYSPMVNETYMPEPYLSYNKQSSAASLYTPGTKADTVVNYSADKPRKSVLHGARGPSKKILTGHRKRNIYESSAKTVPTTDMEYDPIMNYATLENRGKKSKKKDQVPNQGHGVASSQSLKQCDEEVDSEEDLQIAEEEDDGLVIIEEEEEPKPEKLGKELFGTDSDSDAMCPPVKAKEKMKRTDEKNDNIFEKVMEAFSDEGSKESDSSAKIVKSILKNGSHNKPANSSSNEYIPSVMDIPAKTSSLKNSGSLRKPKSSSSKTPNKTLKSKINPDIQSQGKKSSKKSSLKKKSTANEKTKDGKVSKGAKVSKKLKLETKNNQKGSKNKSGLEDKSHKKVMNKIEVKDIDVKDIPTFVDRDEILKLEKELDGENCFEECLQIYQESVAQGSKTSSQEKQDDDEVIDLTVEDEEDAASKTETTEFYGKRRIAHNKAESSAVSLRKPITARKKISTPAQMMMKRLEMIEKERVACTNGPASSSRRIAHSPNVLPNSFARKPVNGASKYASKIEKKIMDNPWFPKASTEPTVCGTNTKGVARIAHHAKASMANDNGSGIPPPPRIAVDRYSKVPTNIRQRYLTTFIKECMRIFKENHIKAYAMAQMEEEQCKKRSNSKNVYLSLAASTVKKLRDMPVSESSKDKNDSKRKLPTNKSNPTKVVTKKAKLSTSGEPPRKLAKISHNNLLDVNTKRCKGGYTIEKKVEKSELTQADMYEKMCKYIMTPEQLDENGYPRPSDVPGKADFRCDPPLKPFNKSDKKICERCGREFMLDKKGKFSREEECTYHWGRPYMTRVGRGWEKRYSCCQEGIGVEGCTVGDTHVHADNKLNPMGYVKTLIKSPPHDGNAGIFALDCEMSYTVNGLELTRVSVLDHNCKLVYDALVKPSGRILDYNTRWSGITEEDLKDVETTIRDVQAVFLAKFSSDTILMGHSLESDLIALRIIHETVIDTAIVFPHKRGPPYKRALRNLVSENLGLVIQNMASEGHDSSEDAAACMKLMTWKLSEDDKVSKKS